MDEATLVGRARNGDEAAWEALVRTHQQPLFRLAYLMLGNVAEAEDAAQEGLVRAYRSLHRFDVTRPMRPWLMRIVANVARNRHRSVARYLAALQRAFLAEPPQPHPPPAVHDDAAALWQAVRRLRATDQQVIYLRYFMELTEAEAAEVMDVALGTVKSRTHRALARLRAVIEAEFPTLREEWDDGRATA